MAEGIAVGEGSADPAAVPSLTDPEAVPGVPAPETVPELLESAPDAAVELEALRAQVAELEAVRSELADLKAAEVDRRRAEAVAAASLPSEALEFLPPGAGEDFAVAVEKFAAAFQRKPLPARRPRSELRGGAQGAEAWTGMQNPASAIIASRYR